MSAKGLEGQRNAAAVAPPPQPVLEIKQTGRRLLQTRMPRAQALGLGLSGLILATTGFALAVFRYLIPSSDAFSSYPHPSWKYVVMAHVVATPVFFFFVGGVWWAHVVRYWKWRRRRVSGATMVTLVAAASLTGYLLYFVGSEAGIGVVRAAHTTAGAAATVFYVFHALAGWRSIRGARSTRNRPPE